MKFVRLRFQIETGDGLPSLICLDCIHQVNRAFTFKQLCEQSDSNLRQYLGKPAVQKQCKKEEESQNYSTIPLLDSFGFDDDDSSNKSDEDDLKLELPAEENDEKTIAQRQLIKAKMQKRKLSKKKLLSKNGGINT